MNLTKHLDLIVKLALDRADPAKIRDQVEFIRDQIDAAEKRNLKLLKQIARNKKSHAKEIAAVNFQHANLKKKLEKSERMILAYHRGLVQRVW